VLRRPNRIEPRGQSVEQHDAVGDKSLGIQNELSGPLQEARFLDKQIILQEFNRRVLLKSVQSLARAFQGSDPAGLQSNVHLCHSPAYVNLRYLQVSR